jgi:hypothetical protein
VDWVDALAVSLGSGVVAGVIATGLWAAIVEHRRRKGWERRVGPMAGEYRITRKLSSEPEPETLVVTVDKNVLTVEARGAAWPYRGEIVMGAQLPGRGAGHYRQRLEDGSLLWGAWEIQQLDADTVVEDRTYASHSKHEAVVSGFVWERVESHARDNDDL